MTFDPGHCNQRQVGWFNSMLLASDPATGLVEGYSTTWVEASTPEGIRIGSTLDETTAIYPDGTTRHDRDENTRLGATDSGSAPTARWFASNRATSAGSTE